MKREEEAAGKAGAGEWMSPAQRKTAAAAVTFFSACVIALLLLGLLLVLKAVLTFFSGVIWPLAAAGILALLLRPMVLSFEKRLKLGRVKSIVLLYALVVLAGSGALSYGLPRLIIQAMNFLESAPELITNARDYFSEKFPSHLAFLKEKWSDETIREYAASAAEGLKQVAAASLPVLKGAGLWVWGTFAWAAGLAVVPIYLFYFLRTDRDPLNLLREQMSFVPAGWRDDLLFLVREFGAILVAFFRGQLLIGLIMGALLAAGFTIVGLKFSLTLGLLTGLLNIVPYLGTILGLGAALPLAFFQPGGGWVSVALVLAVFVVVQIIEGYLLTPKIMGRQTGLHPLAIIIAIFFWGTLLNGILGMVLAVPLTAFFAVAWRLLKRKYFGAAP